jgi:hypothetical protein
LAIHDEEPEALTPEEISSILFSLTFARREITNTLVGNVVRRLLEDIPMHPALASAVRAAGRCLAAAGYQEEDVSPPALRCVSDLWHPIGLTELNPTLRPMLKQIGDPGLEHFINA